MLLSLLEHTAGWKKQSARTWEGPCPRCGGTKRCIAWIHQDLFKCRECDYKGDIITWLRDQQGLSCQQAFDQAGRQCDNSSCKSWDKCRGTVAAPKRVTSTTATVPAAPVKHAPAVSEATEPEAIWQQHAEKLVAWAHEQLMENKEQRDYLEKRGLDLGAVVEYRLGWIPQDLYRTRASWGLPDETKPDGKLKKLWIPQGIVIPFPAAGPVHRIRIRRPVVKGDETRYYWMPGSGNDTLTFNNGKSAAVIVESDLDALLINHLAGDLVNVVSLGTCSSRPKTETTAMLQGCSMILVSLDNDSAGAGQMKWWRENFAQAERWPVVEGKDPGEAYQADIDIREWLIAGLPVSMQPKADSPSKNCGISPLIERGGVKAQNMATVRCPIVHTITARDGRIVHITDDPAQYARLVSAGVIVFDSKELALVKASGADPDQAASFLNAKEVFPGIRIESVGICPPPREEQPKRSKYYSAR